jgi:hypothetical protein
MLTVVWNATGFHVPYSMFWKPSRRGANSMHNILLLYKWYLGRHLRLKAVDRGNTAEQVVGTFWSCSATYCENVKGLHQSQSNEIGTSPPICQIWHPRTFPFRLRQKKANGILR